MRRHSASVCTKEKKLKKKMLRHINERGWILIPQNTIRASRPRLKLWATTRIIPSCLLQIVHLFGNAIPSMNGPGQDLTSWRNLINIVILRSRYPTWPSFEMFIVMPTASIVEAMFFSIIPSEIFLFLPKAPEPRRLSSLPWGQYPLRCLLYRRGV